MLSEDIKPGYAPAELSFMGYTTKNLHHSEDAVKAFQDTIAKAHAGSIRDHQLVKDALMHTDQYMKLNDMHLEQGKAPEPNEVKQWIHMHERARRDLEQLGEFPHHLDYWHNHLHELEAMQANYTPETAGADIADSYTPEGNMVQEELTGKTIKSADRVKVARVIADMLGVENAESMSPDAAVNAGLRKVKNKRMTPEFTGTIRKMVQLAQEVGIKIDSSMIPAAVNEDVVNKDSTYNSAKDILRFNDFAKLSKINQGEVPVNKFSRSGANEEVDPEQAPEKDKTDTVENIPTQVGATMTHPTNDQLRRRKVAYKLGEESKSYQQQVRGPLHSLAGNTAPVRPKYSTAAAMKAVNKTASELLAAKKKREDEYYQREDAELEEDVHSADYKVSSTGHKYRARHIEFANSKMNAEPARAEEDGEQKVKHRKTEPIIKPVKEEVEDERDNVSTESDLDDMVKQIEDEEDILDAYDEDELVIVDQDTGEIVNEMKEEVEQLDEVLSRMERMRSKIRFARTASKRERRLQIALKTRSSSSKINKRARALAVKLMKQRLSKKPVAQMTVSDKERAERIIARRKAVIDRLAMKLAPRIRKIENARLSHSKVTK